MDSEKWEKVSNPVIELVKVLSWPVVFLLIAKMFKEEIKQVISFVT